MGEYRDAPLRWKDGVLDTRGMPLDGQRGLPIPDAIHQVKRALNAKGASLTVLVATRAEADHLERFAEMRALASSTTELEDCFRLTLARP